LVTVPERSVCVNANLSGLSSSFVYQSDVMESAATNEEKKNRFASRSALEKENQFDLHHYLHGELSEPKIDR
jgi:hypothetical protein